MSTPRAGRPARVEGRRVALAFAAFLFVGTIVATAAAIYGHQIGAVARERYEADR